MNSVIIEDYDPRWPERFELLRARLAAALGGKAIAIEHVGSTSVPKLASKPVIDIDVLLRSADDLPSVISQLVALGYKHQGDLGIKGRETFETPPQDFPHHLYVCRPDCDEYRRHLAFRNHLRTHPGDAEVYAELKRKLAIRLGADRVAYTDAKDDFVRGVLCRVLP